MKKQILIATTAILVSLSSSFADTYVCSFPAETRPTEYAEEYSVEVSLLSKQAAFFDNDSWTKVPFTEFRSREVHPPIETYTFKGPDSSGMEMIVIFNQMSLGGTLTESGTGKTLTSYFKCATTDVLNSGI